MHLLDALFYLLFVKSDHAGQVLAGLELVEVAVALGLIDTGEYVHPHLEDLLIRGPFDIHDLVLLEVAPRLHLNDVLVLHSLQWLHDAIGVVQNEVVMQRLSERLELLAQLVPAASTQREALDIVLRFVIVVHPCLVAQLVPTYHRSVAELQPVFELVVEAVSDDVLALSHEVHLL